ASLPVPRAASWSGRRRPAGSLLAGLDIDGVEGHVDGLGVTIAVDLVVPHERRRLDRYVQPVDAVAGHLDVGAVVIKTGVPDERHLEGAYGLAVFRRQGRGDVQI